MTYEVVQVPPNTSTQLEQMGTKQKNWYEDEHGLPILFKEGRPGTGDNWAEKACCEIARLLGLPHAEYDFAILEGRQGVITPSIVPQGGRLILGNEILARAFANENYDSTANNQHTLKRVAASLRHRSTSTPLGWRCPADVGDAFGVFIGYLLLDALVGNQDRHHENWGLIRTASGALYLAPTYDHASSLGRNEIDQNRIDRLTTKDAGHTVAYYAQRARSSLYETRLSNKPLTTLDAFIHAAKIDPYASQYWLRRLRSIDPVLFKEEILEKIPSDWISQPAIDFAYAILTINRNRLLGLIHTP